MKRLAKFYAATPAIILGFLIACTAQAFAQAHAAPVEYPVDVHPAALSLTNFLFDLLSVVVTGLIVWVQGRANLTASSTELLSKTAADGLGWAHERALAAGQDIKNPTVKSQILAEALACVLQAISGRLTHHGLTEAHILTFLSKKLPAVQTGIAIGAALVPATQVVTISEAAPVPPAAPTTTVATVATAPVAPAGAAAPVPMPVAAPAAPAPALDVTVALPPAPGPA